MVDAGDAFERELREVPLPEPTYSADAASPEDLPDGLAFRVVTRARERSTELLAERLIEAAAEAGLSVDDLAWDAQGQEAEAREFLRGWKNPRALQPATLARMLWHAGLHPEQWQTLLSQAVASSVFFTVPAEETIWGRATGVSGDERTDALGVRGPRDPERAGRIAQIFLEEVMEEWTTLTTTTKSMDEDEDEVT